MALIMYLAQFCHLGDTRERKQQIKLTKIRIYTWQEHTILLIVSVRNHEFRYDTNSATVMRVSTTCKPFGFSIIFTATVKKTFFLTFDNIFVKLSSCRRFLSNAYFLPCLLNASLSFCNQKVIYTPCGKINILQS